MRKERLTLATIRKRRGRDIVLILFSVYMAVSLVQTGAVSAWLGSAMGNEVLASFFAGVLFTSLFTIAPSIAAFIGLLQEASFPVVALSGAAGAVMGDLLLFLFVRDAIAEDIRYLIRGSWRKKLLAHARHPLLQWIVPLVGAILIASPLPDELGLAMLGVSRVRLIILMPATFVMNFIGIASIWYGMQLF